MSIADRRHANFGDDVVLTIKGKRHYRWRAVDQNGDVLDILMQSPRNRQAAKRSFRKLLKGLGYALRVLITDRLKSNAAAKSQILRWEGQGFDCGLRKIEAVGVHGGIPGLRRGYSIA